MKVKKGDITMKPFNELLAGLFGTGTCAVGTALQTNEVLQTISLIITILGGIVTLIVLPILNWWHKAKQDGKITTEEIKEGVETLNDGLEKLDKKITGTTSLEDALNQFKEGENKNENKN